MTTLPAEGLLTVSEEPSRGSEALGPVQAVVEDELPDPFLVDDEGDAESEGNTGSDSTSTPPPPLPACTDSFPESVLDVTKTEQRETPSLVRSPFSSSRSYSHSSPQTPGAGRAEARQNSAS